MKKKKTNQSINLKENLPLHKMDDGSRRHFLKQCGIFMTVFGVSSLVRLETLEKLSKKIFGSSMAFAQNSGSLNGTRPCMIIGSRAGLNLAAITGWQTSDLAIDLGASDGSGYFAMNQPYAPASTVRVATPNGPDLVVPSYNSNLTNYAGSIFANHRYAVGPGGHRADHTSSCTGARDNNLLSMCAEQAGLNTILTTPLAFVNPNSVEFTSMNPIYAPNYITNLTNFVNQFVEETITAPDGTSLNPEIRNELFQALAQSYSNQIEAALGTSQAGGSLLQNNQGALALLQTNYQNVLSPTSGYNTQLRNALLAGLPGNTNGINMAVNAVDATITGLRAMQLGITPPYFAINISMQDAHNLRQHARDAELNAGGFGADGLGNNGYVTARVGQYAGGLIYNTLNIMSGVTPLDNPVDNPFTPGSSWAANQFMIQLHTEFSRSPRIIIDSDGTTAVDNPDGNNGQLLIGCADVNQNIFATGSFGGFENVNLTQQRNLYWNPSNNTHGPTGSPDMARSAFSDAAKALGLTETDGTPNAKYFL